MSEKFDVIVIGGGPAGMMAAITAAGIIIKLFLLKKTRNWEKRFL